MAGVTKGLEADHVCAQDTLQDLLAPAQTPVKLAAGKWDVEEEANVDVRKTLAQQAGQKHQLIVVDHDNIARVIELENAIREELIHAVVVCPSFTRSASVCRLILFVVEDGV